jgi:hypothetical protein
LVVAGKSDAIASCWRNQGIPSQIKRLRRTSADYLAKEHGQSVADHFLGHAQGMNAAYFSADQDRLDAAISWLKEYYFRREAMP